MSLIKLLLIFLSLTITLFICLVLGAFAYGPRPTGNFPFSRPYGDFPFPQPTGNQKRQLGTNPPPRPSGPRPTGSQ